MMRLAVRNHDFNAGANNIDGDSETMKGKQRAKNASRVTSKNAQAQQELESKLVLTPWTLAQTPVWEDYASCAGRSAVLSDQLSSS